jgi:hypothetical protein
MTRVISIRLARGFEQAIRRNAARSRMTVSSISGLILEHSLGGQYSSSALRDGNEFLDAKLDIRLQRDLVSKLRTEAKRLGVSVSVYIRRILYAYYMKRLVFIESDGRYTLEENHD